MAQVAKRAPLSIFATRSAVLELAITNPPKAGERVKIFNQVTETHRVRELADLVSRLTGAEVRYYVNPRNESAENELRVRNDQFLALGLNPITLNEGLLSEVIDVAAKYRRHLQPEKMVRNSVWRSLVLPWDGEGTGRTAPRSTVSTGSPRARALISNNSMKRHLYHVAPMENHH